MSARLLCEYGLLQNITRTHWATGAAVREVRFRSTKYRDPAFSCYSGSVESNGDRVARLLKRRVHRAFADTTRANLYPSHLIQRA
jgi:hypothetical protein